MTKVYTPTAGSQQIDKGGKGDGENVTGMGITSDGKTVYPPADKKGSNN